MNPKHVSQHNQSKSIVCSRHYKGRLFTDIGAQKTAGGEWIITMAYSVYMELWCNMNFENYPKDVQVYHEI